jgi:ribosomal protein S18 acetylase RimI-like enzyme
MSAPALTIRRLERSDLAACVALYQQAYAIPPYGQGWDQETSERIILEFQRLFPQECFVAERGGEVAGFILCSSLAGLRATIEEFAVHPRHQKQGVGRRLLDHVVTVYRERGVPFLELIANDEAPAYGFYRRQGFTEPEHYRLMSKTL